MSIVNAKLANDIKKLYGNEYSAPLIAKNLNLSISQVYRSLKRQNIKRRNPTIQNKIRFENSPLSFAFKSGLSNREKELMVAALMLYYGEGAKTSHTVDIANSDPAVLQLFIKFLRKICRVQESKLRFYLYCFSNQDSEKLIEFWANKLTIDKNQFTKPYVRKIDNTKNNTRIMQWGVLHIRYNDKRLLEKILFLCSSVVAKLII